MPNRKQELLYRLWRDKEVQKSYPGSPTEWQLRKEYLEAYPERNATEADITIYQKEGVDNLGKQFECRSMGMCSGISFYFSIMLKGGAANDVQHGRF